jgi:formate/nitrite transporter FocA (FNT family)
LVDTIKRSVLAGVLISVGALFSLAASQYGNVVQGVCFSVGLFGVLICGACLFTGGVLVVRDVWDGELTISEAVETLCLVWVFNLVGATAVAAMALVCGFDVAPVACAKAATPWYELVVRGILCNVLVCLSAHMFNTSERTVTTALLAALPPVACFVACGFEHSVADMLYMQLGLMQGVVTLPSCAMVLALATVGNVVGGVAFSWLVRE